MNSIQRPAIQTVIVTAFWMVSLSAVGQETTETPAPNQTQTAAASSPTSDQMLAGEFELLQEPIIESASKREESVFASPFSSDVITRDQIQKAGARNIAEALRLLPGVIVREQSSGNFDVHIRGMDDIPPGGYLHAFLPSTQLVMIDYRPVYNYIFGGTFWEALPIDIIDVERIELVRGPVAAYYGPNAATGVINIITRKQTTDGLQASARAEGALTSRDNDWSNNYRLGQRILSGRISYKKDPFSIGLSANYLSLDRLINGIYSYKEKKYLPRDDVWSLYADILPRPETALAAGKEAYPEPNLGQRSIGFNGFATYEPTDKLSFNLTAGYQESRAVRENSDMLEMYSPLSTTDTRTSYLDLRSHFYDFTFQASFLTGQFMVLASGANEDIRERYKYDYYTLDLNLDYAFEWEWLRVRPGVSFRRAQYAGAPFAGLKKISEDEWQDTGKTKVLQSASVSVALEQTPWKKFRFVEAVRLDVYFDRTEYEYYPLGATDALNPETKHGQVVYPSFQFAATYTPLENHIIRISYARANKSPCMSESFANYDISIIQVSGNKALDLLTVDTIELGYRTRFNQQMDMSLEIFGTYARDFTYPYLHGFDSEHSKLLTLYDNFDLKAYQLGATVSFGFTTRLVQGRVFATIQQTRIDDYDPAIVNPLGFTYNYDQSQDYGPHKATPDVFGGFYVNYQPANKWNINLNAYFFSRHTQVHLMGEVPIQQSFLLNAKASYNFWDGLTAFVNVRNLFNINQAQFTFGDANHILCFIGLQYDL